jgi:hypothetical protein
MLTDTCLSVEDLVLLQNYVGPDLTPLSVASLLKDKSSELTDSKGKISEFFHPSPNNTELRSLSLNSDTFSKIESTFPFTPDNATEKTGGTSGSSRIESEQEGTGLKSAKQSRAVLRSEVIFGTSDTLSFSQDVIVGSKSTEKLNLDVPENVNLSVNSDILLQKTKNNDFTPKNKILPTACYKGNINSS